MKTKILFVCLGNICRSPAAESIMKHQVKEAGRENDFFIDSAGLSDWHEGDLPDRRMYTHARRRGYLLDSLSRPVKVADFERFDMILGMDSSNIRMLQELAPDSSAQQKIGRITDFCQQIVAHQVPDPYYGGSAGFDQVLDILEDACAGLLRELEKTRFRKLG
ncbi:MAG: low molecular weight phosphotyrosine protein phosphatase [Bacteroidales bacterium]|jgi:protein-tyrosine phosphatase|nr:low molecular weight phosphotyrosine protein phosphatase [Bacteroidales bacterium]